jgi:thymidylate kinase
MNLKVISDGTVMGTRVVNADTGEELSGVKAVKWEISTESITADVVIVLAKVPVEIAGQTKEADKARLDELSKNL